MSGFWGEDHEIDDRSYNDGYQAAIARENIETANDAHSDGFLEGFEFATETLLQWMDSQPDRVSKSKLLKFLDKIGGDEID